ncbi:MAG TPA: ribosome biogenesis GTP-binding protein YihA/YsxC [Sedimentibacter sp.]|jgi:GTP-binding protein|nr:YihA family ribosome biogenesis GTP-binding protein [Sedimentibacter sp.]NLA14573.1 YihA family ribosome biogenesis GTP-binding protein [Tissierellia bacterium]HAS92484.1 YihA family ribosome biogenesis GTP-binding protein [Clostridiales bacterium]HOA19013.1 ribosome biogenesis GTP-binding protein YihA/YsxC [Sedimentibacter sp.]HOG62029.1 ribosome biogenesis GTP-binding protein YihA/YsxC [Sedimentibacter sp.]
MIIRKAEFLISAVKKEQYPNTGVPEIAFAGKSNVGKSSMINALVNRRNLAKTSSQPGKTQTLNFYNINDEFNFVDLPGYGYAKVSKAEQAKWADMIDLYLHSRQQLKEVILLVDIRHEPGRNDLLMYEWIKSFGFKGYIIATKADKLSKSQQIKSLNNIKKTLQIKDIGLIYQFSSTSKLGVEEIWILFESILNLHD